MDHALFTVQAGSELCSRAYYDALVPGTRWCFKVDIISCYAI